MSRFNNFLQQHHIEIYFQPIVSTVNKKIIGFEALTRASINNQYISPLIVFAKAKEEEFSFELDKYVRSLAIRKFSAYVKQDPSLLLFLNFESSLIDKDIAFEEFDFYDVCKEENISPSNIVLEIREDQIKNTRLLKKFSQYYKAVGFNIALDDFGIGGSTFDRLSLVQPDIVKIDRSIIENINKNFINSEILKAITKMCYKIGAVVLAEGVETKEEILLCKKNDISIYQGFYFCKAVENINSIKNCCQTQIEEIITAHAQQIKKHQHNKEERIVKSIDYCNYVIDTITQLNINTFTNDNLKSFVQKELNLEALYLIDYNSAKQIGETIIGSEIKKFYSPAQHGDCHYLKDYYYFTKASKEQSYLSPKYISKATGNMCRTFAKKFLHQNKELILCLDMRN